MPMAFLRVTDGTGDTAKLSFNGSYTLANFDFASDGAAALLSTIRRCRRPPVLRLRSPIWRSWVIIWRRASPPLVTTKASQC